MELRGLEAKQAEREHQEEASKQKKVAEEQEKCDWRAEQEWSQVAFTGTIKTKKLDELHDIAAALRLPETGLKAELLQRVVQLFNDQPELKKNQHTTRHDSSKFNTRTIWWLSTTAYPSESTLDVAHGSSPTRLCTPILSHAPFHTSASASTYSSLCAGW
ncbi:uncharacterized protein EDB91DRAFT_1252779 [Suillus paluster]|uniref:uncharacterized protein n=1 Tax=Suillus paluster TaxID=48578 RepID=UPI001B883134|nr:uncharacterized protein EDB91DRAFT_1252779 [Suillus paluster]KAG1730129.1 hypothetical protein EDB91DRAFT_1252779 [Suillus paluster]